MKNFLRNKYLVMLFCLFLPIFAIADDQEEIKDILSNIEIIGIAEFSDSKSVLIKSKETGLSRFYDIDDEINGLFIENVKMNAIVFLYNDKSYTYNYNNKYEITNLQKEKKEKSYSYKSLKKKIKKSKKLFKSPLKFINPMSRASFRSGFGFRKHPMGGGTRFHRGVDISAPSGSPVYAAADGKVSFAGRNGGYGKCIRISHKNSYKTFYAHLSKILVKSGEYIEQGDVIGYEGNTGQSTGPHLHFEIMKGRVPVDPTKYIDF